MDWINEKLELLKEKTARLPLRYALIFYLCTALFISFICSRVTAAFCNRWLLILSKRGSGHTGFLEAILTFSPFIYMGGAMLIAALMFWRERLKQPFATLKACTGEIRQNNLDFSICCKNPDEMGELCASFEQMRKELVANKEEMWNLIEEQKKINAAFAHDLRTPLTVLKGYTDFLYRYIPEGKISEAKMTDTLKLMSQHLERLTVYSGTMRKLRSFEELTPRRAEITLERLAGHLRETADALDAVGDIHIRFLSKNTAQVLFIDELMVMEVFDNLLSNAIRYAKELVEISLEADPLPGLLYLYVKDDGPGFTPEALRMAAKPYFHEDGITGEHFGIGLHIADRLCQNHGGTLSIANSIHGGAFVSVSFFFQNS